MRAGVYRLARLFHFGAERRNTRTLGEGKGLLEEMRLVHVVDGRELILYNRMTSARVWEHVSETPLCPYCGGLLSTPFARHAGTAGRIGMTPRTCCGRGGRSRCAAAKRLRSEVLPLVIGCYVALTGDVCLEPRLPPIGTRIPTVRRSLPSKSCQARTVSRGCSRRSRSTCG